MINNFDKSLEEQLSIALQKIALEVKNNDSFRSRWDEICKSVGIPITADVLSQNDLDQSAISVKLSSNSASPSNKQPYGILEIIKRNKRLIRKCFDNPKEAYVLAIELIADLVNEDNSLAPEVIQLLEGDQEPSKSLEFIFANKKLSATYKKDPNKAYAQLLRSLAKGIAKSQEKAIDIINRFGWSEHPLDGDGKPILTPSRQLGHQ